MINHCVSVSKHTKEGRVIIENT